MTAMDLLKGKLALVTGGGRGNGAAIARGLARYGADVVVTDIDGPAAAAVAEEIRDAGGRSWSFTMDVADPALCAAAAAEVEAAAGPVSVLVNNAGIIRRDALDDPTAHEAWNACLDVNATGVFNVTMAFLPQLRRTRGAVANMTSITGFVTARTFPGYAASKAAVVAATRGFAVKLAADGVRVNAVAPGPFATPMTASTRANSAAGDYYINRVPLGRFGEPEEIVGPVAFIVSDMASFVTGTTLVVDGGLLAE